MDTHTIHTPISRIITYLHSKSNFQDDLTFYYFTVFENRLKSLIQHCERSELRLHFEWTKVTQKCQKWSIFAGF